MRYWKTLDRDLQEKILTQDDEQVNGHYKYFMETNAEEVLAELNPIMKKLLEESQAFRLLPEEFRMFLMTKPENMFTLGLRLKKATDLYRYIKNIEDKDFCPPTNCKNKMNCPILTMILNLQVQST